MKRSACLAAAVLAGAVSSSALAEESAFKQAHALLDASPQDRSQELGLFVGFPWFYGLGIDAAVRYNIPIVKDGFLPMLNDSFDIEFGGDFAYIGVYYGSLMVFTGDVGARWTFYILPKFAAYAKVDLGIGYTVASYACTLGYYCTGVIPAVHGTLGVVYHVAEKFALRAELGSFGIRGGIGIDF